MKRIVKTRPIVLLKMESSDLCQISAAAKSISVSKPLSNEVVDNRASRA